MGLLAYRTKHLSAFRASVALLSVLLPACGGGGGGGESQQDPLRHRSGDGYLSISEPSDNHAFQTDQVSVRIAGRSFNFNLRSWCPDEPFVFPPYNYHVTWINKSTQKSGNADVGISCEFYDLKIMRTLWEIDSTTFPFGVELATGSNEIEVTASDGNGNTGSDIIRITRIPDVSPPTVVNLEPAAFSHVGAIHQIAIEFSEPIHAPSLNATNIKLMAVDRTEIPTTVFADTRSARIVPISAPLPVNAEYLVEVSTGVEDLNGVHMATPFNTSIFTGP